MVWVKVGERESTPEEAKSGEGEAGEEDRREDEEEGAPEEPVPSYHVPFSAILLHASPPPRSLPRNTHAPHQFLFFRLIHTIRFIFRNKKPNQIKSGSVLTTSLLSRPTKYNIKILSAIGTP